MLPSDSCTIGGMERVRFLIRVKPEHLDEYKRRHRAVWPEMLPYFDSIEPGKRPGKSFVRLEEVFHLD